MQREARHRRVQHTTAENSALHTTTYFIITHRIARSTLQWAARHNTPLHNSHTTTHAVVKLAGDLKLSVDVADDNPGRLVAREATLLAQAAGANLHGSSCRKPRRRRGSKRLMRV